MMRLTAVKSTSSCTIVTSGVKGGPEIMAHFHIGVSEY